MQRITLKTRKKREVLDITKTVEALLQRNHPQATGICNLVILHTTAALTTADLDPGTEMGPLIHGRHLDRVQGYIRAGLAEGARLEIGRASCRERVFSSV